MNPGTAQTAFQILLTLGIIATAIGGLGSYHFGKKFEQQKEDVMAVKEKELNGRITELITGKNEVVAQNKELLVKVEKYQIDLEEKDLQIKELESKAKMAERGIISIYDFRGNKRQKTAGSVKVTVGAENQVFNEMIELEKDKDFSNLKKLCEQQIEKTPDWFTPYLFRGVAYANMGKKGEAIKDLHYVVDNTLGDPEYEQAERLLQQLEETP